ncbi:MAG: methyl-accepting chemotaxis protein [Bacillota bacterium]
MVSEKVSQLVRQIEELKNDIQSTSQVVDFIREVSEQTNLLALNAAIEAARAGEQGRGFAVVAEEVRKLAEKTRESIDTISDTVASIQRQIQVSVAESEPILAEVARSREMAREAEGLFSSIVEEVVKSSEQIQDLTAASQELSASMEEVSAGSEEIAKLARHSEVTFTETGRGIYGFTQSMEKLRQALAGFQVQLGDEQMLSYC